MWQLFFNVCADAPFVSGHIKRKYIKIQAEDAVLEPMIEACHMIHCLFQAIPEMWQ
jgi:hypothetical protein